LNQPYINVSSLNNLTVYGLLNQKVGQHREFSLVGGNKKFFTPKFKFLPMHKSSKNIFRTFFAIENQ
jgi:hypothetical protein